ncbi:hypothetical protein B0H14DRAFT_891548 [Mycena olivaceomarginata]|nr:hypothetical protein B0H14DRAFT_891548 [Mycena olivaceomarginata]
MHKNLRRGPLPRRTRPQLKNLPRPPRAHPPPHPRRHLAHKRSAPRRRLPRARPPQARTSAFARVRSLADIASGLFLCTLALQFEVQLSKRLVPEAVNFAVNSVLHLAPYGWADVRGAAGRVPRARFRLGALSGAGYPRSQEHCGGGGGEESGACRCC